MSHGLQDVEGDKPHLVVAVTTLPPALGGFDDLSDRRHVIYLAAPHTHTHTSSCVILMPSDWLRYLERLPLLHRQLTAVPGYELVGAAVESLRREGAAISARRRRRAVLF